MNNRKHGQRIHNNKMGHDSLDENAPNALEFICPICLPKSKVLDFDKKGFIGCLYSVEYPEFYPSCDIKLAMA